MHVVYTEVGVKSPTGTSVVDAARRESIYIFDQSAVKNHAVTHSRNGSGIKLESALVYQP